MTCFHAVQKKYDVISRLLEKGYEVLDRQVPTNHMVGGGDLACAQAIHDLILKPVFNSNKDLSSNKAHIGTLVKDLERKNLFKKVVFNSENDIQTGDLVITGNANAFNAGGHMGIALDNGIIANNSSSQKAFVNTEMRQVEKKITTLYRPTGKTL